jgi:uncharacterized Ntn-hydrolase superfamily protein/acetyl esterase/lipase
MYQYKNPEMKKIHFLCLFLLSTLMVFAQDTEYETLPNIPYYPESVRQGDEYIRERCVLDLYYPVNMRGFPTVVWFHGGGLSGGNKFIPDALKEKGLCVIAVNYRLHPAVQSPTYVEDAAAAVAWVFKHIEDYGGDRSAIFISGHSAGGYLTMMVGLDKRWLGKHGIDANLIAGLIPFSGHTITHMTIREERGIPNTQPVVDKMAPLYHVRADAPPLLLITGDRELEMLGRYEENAYMMRMMKVAGHKETRIFELDGYGHSMAYPAFPLLINEIRRITGARGSNAKGPLAHTYSIVARDKETGEMAVGVQSHWFSVGTIVSWGQSGVGVVATQSFVNPAFGPDGIKLMKEGKDAKQVVDILINGDEGREYRQLAVLDAHGRVSAYTGRQCIESADHIVGDNYSVQANMMLNDKVVPAMAEAFEKNGGLPLAERIIAVLKAAQQAGGDIRGSQSAALVVVGPEPAPHRWQDKRIDIRVDDHPEPLAELQRLLQVHRAYEHMNRGDLAVEKGDMTAALKEYGQAESMFPGNLEMKYWKAVALANNGLVSEALPIFREIFNTDGNWRELTRRLPASGLLNLPEDELDQILDQ